MKPILAIFAAGCLLAAPAAIAESFRGYPCTVDCSGHEAGYEWAERNDITDPDDCGGNSNSFIEGCQSRAEELQDEDEAETSGESEQ